MSRLKATDTSRTVEEVLRGRILSHMKEKESLTNHISNFQKRISDVNKKISAIEETIKDLNEETQDQTSSFNNEQPFFSNKEEDRTVAIVKIMEDEGEIDVPVRMIGEKLSLKRETVLAWMTRRVRSESCPWEFGKNNSNFTLKKKPKES